MSKINQLGSGTESPKPSYATGNQRGAPGSGQNKKGDSNARAGDTSSLSEQATELAKNIGKHEKEQGDSAPKSLKDATHKEEHLHDFAKQKRLLASCERVNLLNMTALTLNGYPDNWEMDSARKTRDVMMMVSSILLGMFIIGLSGLLPAAIAGLSLGMCALLAFLAFSPLQTMFTNKPSLTELSRRRRQLVSTAKSHVQFLEGTTGLAWRCEALGDYNRHLYGSQFSALLQYSKQGALARVLNSQRHFRLYLLYMIEAQKAYKRLQAAYLSEGFNLSDESAAN